MEDKKMLNEEELEKVIGGFEYEGKEYSAVELLDRCIDAMNTGDIMAFSTFIGIMASDASRFHADIEKAGRTIPDALLKEMWF